MLSQGFLPELASPCGSSSVSHSPWLVLTVPQVWLKPFLFPRQNSASLPALLLGYCLRPPGAQSPSFVFPLASLLDCREQPSRHNPFTELKS